MSPPYRFAFTGCRASLTVCLNFAQRNSAAALSASIPRRDELRDVEGSRWDSEEFLIVEPSGVLSLQMARFLAKENVPLVRNLCPLYSVYYYSLFFLPGEVSIVFLVDVHKIDIYL